jgi:predicted DNA-binding transcriptional regulator YafY
LRADLNDLKALGYEVGFDRKRNHYYWANSPFGLALDDAQLAALDLLRRTFANQTFPRVAEIRALLDSLVARLPAEQARALDRLPPRLAIHLPEIRSDPAPHPHTLQAIEAALKAHRQLEFAYQSPKNIETVRHCITIESFVAKDSHVYLYGWETGSSELKQFRCERIVPYTARSAASAQRGIHYPYQIAYRAAPELARGGVSPRFDNMQIEPQPDGGALVRADTANLWEAHKILLSYGQLVYVLSPPALVALMRQAVSEMARLYGVDES